MAQPNSPLSSVMPQHPAAPPLLLSLLLQPSAMPLLLPFSNRTLQVVLVWSLLPLLLLPPLVLLLLLLLFFWQFKEKIKRNCRQTPAAKLAESSSLQVACVCVQGAACDVEARNEVRARASKSSYSNIGKSSSNKIR
jgi:hypothetical protein